MFKFIRKNYVSGTVIVNGMLRVVDHNAVLTHYVVSLHMRLEGRTRHIMATFYPEQGRLHEIIDAESRDQTSSEHDLPRPTVRVELLDVRKSRFSSTCTAKLINAEVISGKKMLVKSGGYLPLSNLNT